MNNELYAKEMNVFEKFLGNIKNKWYSFKRKHIPYLVYHGQDIDVRLIWGDNKLPKNCSMEHAKVCFNGGQIAQIEKLVREIGIDFDTGMGRNGRDWELDWSLRGNLQVKFTGHCKTLDKRK